MSTAPATPDPSATQDAALAAAPAPTARLTPKAIVRQLDLEVIGQDDAKRTLAVAIYSHQRKLEAARLHGTLPSKSNILMIGPSGTGKTLMCEALARFLDLPFVTADATAMLQTRYVNDELEALLQRLLDAADGDLSAAQRGIVFIDEIDKLKARDGQPAAVSGESVQHALLRVMEGSLVRLRGAERDGQARYLDTTGILFICGGAFVGLDDIMSRNRSYGFLSTEGTDDRTILDRLNARVKPTDLMLFGLIPEFTGRLPVVARLHDLDRAALVRIMTEPRNALYRQCQAVFEAEGVELVIEPRVFEEIADLALEYRTGARSLRGIFEELVTPMLYVVPDQPEIRRVTITSLFAGPTVTRGR
jgi:ATP-dependent Clp protease ATP-binding subunit ClpX